MCFPTRVDEVSSAVRLAEAARLPLRAIGGGWSFSDAVLPGMVATSRPDVGTADRLAYWLPLAEGFPPPGVSMPAPGTTLIPSVAIIDSTATGVPLISYDMAGREVTGTAMANAVMLDFFLGGAQPKSVCLINTRSIKSSLQDKLDSILSADAKTAIEQGKRYFHVEAGITIEELGPLLDAQSPRLVLAASGGNPGATIAGSISTGTHGAEFNEQLLVDRVKAIHLVGPGGLQWWIEGDDPIADPEALMMRYPCLARERIISGTAKVLGATPQDWLNAIVVSMGSIGVIYSVVLEVAEVTAATGGMREVVSQTTWWRFLAVASGTPVPVDTAGNPIPSVLQAMGIAGEAQLRIPALDTGLSTAGVRVLTDGSFNGQIEPGANVYADLAFNPNRRADGDLDCWIVNRNKVPFPFDPQPPDTASNTAVISAVFNAMSEAFGGDVGALVNRLGRVYGFVDPVLGVVNQLLNPAAPFLNTVLQGLIPGPAGLILGQLLLSANPGPIVAVISRISGASDKLDVALDELTRPMANSQSTDLAQPMLSGILAAVLGTANSNPGISIGTSVGAIGFPNQGLVGAGLEVAMPEAMALNFIQTEILDRMSRQMPFFGYVSVRICPKTNALLGMPQWDKSVMIEIVSFGDPWGRTFITTLQTRIVSQILSGALDATLHWGLENDQLTAAHLARIPAFATPTPGLATDPTNPAGAPINRIQAFKQIRDAIRAAGGTNPSALFRAFDNAFTARLGL